MLLANIKMERQRWPEMLLMWKRYETQYVVIVMELLRSYCGARYVESQCKESNILDTNWLRYLFSSYLNKVWLSVCRHHLANLHIFKNVNISSHTVYLFMFQNGLNRKGAIFGIVPL